ncbi:MAG: patatin-like phospholipase family protein [Rhodospirillales bacterium]|nr:patatin-like phospholipase family protein [Rhodospirillales bacterium]
MNLGLDNALSGWGGWIKRRLAQAGYGEGEGKSDERLITPGKVRILSIDGGGIRGVIPAIFLREIEKRLQQEAGTTEIRLADRFDLIAGTSAGGILALVMTVPGPDGRPLHSSQDLIDLWAERGDEVFGVNIFTELMSMGTRKYSSEGMHKLLTDYMRETKLSDALREVLITSFCLDTGQSQFFKRRRARIEPHEDFLMRDVALATASAPIYFAPAVFKDLGGGEEHGYIDGGVIANNPAICAVTEARRRFPQANDVVVVSLGTGYCYDPIDHKKAANWGSIQWARPLVDVLIDGPRAAVDHQLRELLVSAPEEGARYFRFQTQLASDETATDNALPENIDKLCARATGYLEKPETKAMLDQLIPLIC